MNPSGFIPDYTPIEKGTIPWTVEGYLEMAERITKLTNTPRDEWDPRPIEWPVIDIEGERHVWELDIDEYGKQIVKLFQQWYPGDATTVASHWHRFDQIAIFLFDNRERLLREKLIEISDGEINVTTALLKVLVASPYEQPVRHDDPDDEDWTFHVDTVVRRAKMVLSAS